MSGPVRDDNDPAAQVANELRARLRTLSGDDLVELCAQLLTTYVVEGVLPLSRAAESKDLAPDTVGEESFAQLLKRLKAAKKDPVLERFIIDGENISVRIDGQGVLPLTEYRRPTATGNIYNRALYQEESAAAQAPQPPRPAPATPPSAPSPAPPQSGQKKEEPKRDRFSLIELE